ncbi:hypothetical protein [Pseudohalioglobus sediminis]|uniref:hypothetical protein n=1 Tax=Pseudohalioglobus sediminis TaxID=2606449 RepID=UPI00165FBB3B|nr:hypothetical protein [Pseudohalioglobus sediminis]
MIIQTLYDAINRRSITLPEQPPGAVRAKQFWTATLPCPHIGKYQGVLKGRR